MSLLLYGPRGEEYRRALQAEGVSEQLWTWAEATELPERLETISGIIGWAVPQSVVDACPNLEWIQSVGAGVDWVLPLTLPPAVTVTRIVHAFGTDMAEYALLYALAWVKDIRRLERQNKRHEWISYTVGTLREKTVGVLGAGTIGREVARSFAGHVQRVRALSRTRPNIPGVVGFVAPEMENFLSELDILVVTVPLTPDTHHMVSDAQLFRLKSGAFLINMARGSVVDTDAVLRALDSGQLSGAALDVFEQEPLPVDHPLWERESVFVTPHLSGPSRVGDVARYVAENIRRWETHAPLVGVVDRGRGY